VELLAVTSVLEQLADDAGDGRSRVRSILLENQRQPPTQKLGS
jgi:hypothetical protein